MPGPRVGTGPLADKARLTLSALRSVLVRRLEGVEGWTTEAQLSALLDLGLAAPGSAPTFVEIGSWKGRSTIALATALEARGDGGKVFAVDPHLGSSEHRREGEAVDTYTEFLANVRRAGVDDYVEPLRMPSLEASTRFSPGSVSLLFIDGSHDYPDVLADLDAWTPLLAPGAGVAVDDVLWPGVLRALLRRVVRRGTPFRDARQVRFTLFFDYRPATPWHSADSAATARLAARLLAHHVRARLSPRPKPWASRPATPTSR